MVKTVNEKWLWSSSIVLLVLCVVFYAQKQHEKAVRIAKETELLSVIEAKNAVENKLTEAKKQIAARDEQIKLAMDRIEKETAVRKDLEGLLTTVEKEKQNLSAQIEQLTAKPGKRVELEKIVVTGIKGKIVSYDKKGSFVITDLGSQDNIKTGDILSVYRNEAFIGKIQIEKLEGATSSAVALTPWKNVEFKENDAVRM